jgi:hypothetical protein
MALFGDLQVSAELLPATQREHRRVTTELRSWLPDVAVVVVSVTLTARSVTFLDQQGEVLDAGQVPWDLADAAITLFGFGCWTLPGTGLKATRFRTAWKS